MNLLSLYLYRIQIAQSYSFFADWILDVLLSFFNTFSSLFSFLEMAFAIDFIFRTFFDLFICTPFTLLQREMNKGKEVDSRISN